MNRDQRIRSAVAHLKGQAREDAISFYLTHPKALKSFHPKPPQVVKRTTSKRLVTLAVRLTPEEYIAIRDKARKLQLSMTSLIVRDTLNLPCIL